MYNIMSSANRDSFTYFPVGIPLISFSCFIASASTSGTTLKMSRDGGHTCLILDLTGVASRFSPVRMC